MVFLRVIVATHLQLHKIPAKFSEDPYGKSHLYKIYDQFRKYFSAKVKGSIAIANQKISKKVQGEMLFPV